MSEQPDERAQGEVREDRTGILVVIAALSVGILSALGGTAWLLTSVANKAPPTVEQADSPATTTQPSAPATPQN